MLLSLVPPPPNRGHSGKLVATFIDSLAALLMTIDKFLLTAANDLSPLWASHTFCLMKPTHTAPGPLTHCWKQASHDTTQKERDVTVSARIFEEWQ